ncbi:methyltransferase domain-containing protein [bacterium]|nr:methyltransferase domain-containing protein [bacterium]
MTRDDGPGPSDPIPGASQVPASRYAFDGYMTKGRWCSFWHQASLVSACGPREMLEVGVGNGLMGFLCRGMGIHYRSVDPAEDLGPDIVASVQRIPLPDRVVDLACAFQVLEHLPYEEARLGFRELCRVSRRDVLLSLPHARWGLSMILSMPILGTFRAVAPSPLPPLGKMIPSHRWEIGRPGFPLRRIVADFGSEARLLKTFRVPENPYHQFFHFERS